MKKLLLLIDLQKGWLHKTATEPAMLRAIEVAKQFDGDVIHCRFRNEPNSAFHTALHWQRFVDTPDIEEIEQAEALQLPTYWRSTYSCVTDELKPRLTKYDHIYIAGVFTDISVAATAMQIFDMNIPITVIRDCVATLHGDDVHVAALKSLEHAIGRRHVQDASAIIPGRSS